MNKDRLVGTGLMAGSGIIILVYAYILFATSYDILLLKITGLIAVLLIFGILAWIGYTLATTPPPKPIEEIEKELEEELKKLEKELEEPSTKESEEKENKKE